ncbi:NAD(+) kinase [Xanthoria calcicola]
MSESNSTPGPGDEPRMKVSPETQVLGSALLRDYCLHLDPSNTNGASHVDEQLRDAMKNFPDPPASLEASIQSSPPATLSTAVPGRSDLLHGPRKGASSIGSAPHQPMLKALASRSPKNGPLAPISVKGVLSHRLHSTDLDDRHGPKTASAQPDLSQNLSARLKYPCFFHQRFDDAVNTERVLEEIAAEDDGFSHSRLMQTATSVREISKQLQRRPIRRAVKTIMIVTKARDNSLVYLTRELTEWLFRTPRYNSDLGVTVYVDAKLRRSKRFDASSLLAENPRYESMLKYWTPDLCWSSPEMFDLVLTLGGDGTVLFTSWLFQRIVPPILSFSLGSLGFLTNFEFSSYKTHLNRIMGDHGMRVNLRMRFTCTVFRSPTNSSLARVPTSASSSNPRTLPSAPSTEMAEGEQFEVLNELVIDRGPSPYVSNLELYGDNNLLTVVQADGCIISTPTGSTAYSLSAGGPLTHPSIPGILLTPICPHTLSFRPMVLSDTLLLKICVPRSSRSTAYASFDGKGRVELRRGDYVQVEAGRYPFPTVVGEGGTGGEWFESVRRALRWNNRGAVQKGFNSAGDRAGVHAFVEAGDEGSQGGYIEDGGDDDGGDVVEEGEEEWDIDVDPTDGAGSRGGTDSGIGDSSAAGSGWSSPRGRKGSGAIVVE